MIGVILTDDGHVLNLLSFGNLFLELVPIG